MAAIDSILEERLKKWLSKSLGVPISAMSDGMTSVVATDQDAMGEPWLGYSPCPPLRAVRIGNSTVIVAREEWTQSLRELASQLHPDILFSTFGAYELARVTLPYGVAVWGPDYYLFGDKRTVKVSKDSRVSHIGPADLVDLDYSVFWHCRSNSLTGFAVFDGEKLLALSTVWDIGEPFYEIGMDVLPNARGNGLGGAVVGAAARWILGQGKLVTASVAPFNSPSLRTLRSVGLRYVFSKMKGLEGPMNLFPQQLGLPLPNTPVYNYYPDWAMNGAILSKNEGLRSD